MSSYDEDDRSKGKYIYRRWRMVNGKREYPKFAKAFKIWVADEPDNDGT